MTYKTHLNCLKASFIAVCLLFFQPLFCPKQLCRCHPTDREPESRAGSKCCSPGCGQGFACISKRMGRYEDENRCTRWSEQRLANSGVVLQLVDEGKLSLDDKVVKYLPVFEKYGKNYITLRHCLTHQTGIQDRGGKITRLIDRRRYTSLDEQAADYASKEIETNPGTAFSYSNMGLVIAGRVLEVVSKKRFDLLIKQKLLTPLGMRQTSFSTTDGSAPDPAEGAKSTAADYMAFLKCC
jgi:hypothetical protein